MDPSRPSPHRAMVDPNVYVSPRNWSRFKSRSSSEPSEGQGTRQDQPRCHLSPLLPSQNGRQASGGPETCLQTPLAAAQHLPNVPATDPVTYQSDLTAASTTPTTSTGQCHIADGSEDVEVLVGEVVGRGSVGCCLDGLKPDVSKGVNLSTSNPEVQTTMVVGELIHDSNSAVDLSGSELQMAEERPANEVSWSGCSDSDEEETGDEEVAWDGCGALNRSGSRLDETEAESPANEVVWNGCCDADGLALKTGRLADEVSWSGCHDLDDAEAGDEEVAWDGCGALNRSESRLDETEAESPANEVVWNGCCDADGLTLKTGRLADEVTWSGCSDADEMDMEDEEVTWDDGYGAVNRSESRLDEMEAESPATEANGVCWSGCSDSDETETEGEEVAWDGYAPVNRTDSRLDRMEEESLGDGISWSGCDDEVEMTTEVLWDRHGAVDQVEMREQFPPAHTLPQMAWTGCEQDHRGEDIEMDSHSNASFSEATWWQARNASVNMEHDSMSMTRQSRTWSTSGRSRSTDFDLTDFDATDSDVESSQGLRPGDFSERPIWTGCTDEDFGCQVRTPQATSRHRLPKPPVTRSDGSLDEVTWDRILAGVAAEDPEEAVTKHDFQVLALMVNDMRRKHLQRIRTMLQGSSEAGEEDYTVVHRPESELNLKWQIRQYCLFLMRRRKADSPIASVSPHQVTRFKRGNGAGPSLNPFILDLDGTPRNKWNSAAADLFAEALLSSGWTRCQDVNIIREMFFVHIGTLKNIYQKQSHDDTEQQEDREKEQQARRDRRRRGTRNRRAEACDLHNDLARYKPIWNAASWEVCSGDESEGETTEENGYYSVTTLPWRSPSFVKWSEPFDVISLLKHFKADGKMKRGNLPRERRRGGSRPDRKSEAPAGLPVNFYDSNWLETLHKDARKALNIQPAIDMRHTDAIMKIWRDFRNFKAGSRCKLPLPNPLIVKTPIQRPQPRRKTIMTKTFPPLPASSSPSRVQPSDPRAPTTAPRAPAPPTTSRANRPVPPLSPARQSEPRRNRAGPSKPRGRSSRGRTPQVSTQEEEYEHFDLTDLSGTDADEEDMYA